MKTAIVVIDDWKLPIFRKHLDEAGYTYIEQPGIMPDTLFLKVQCKRITKLQKIVEKSQHECMN